MKKNLSANDKKLIHCKNCGESFRGFYCNNCGQDGHTGRVDKHFLYHEIQHSLFHIDKGILYTLKELFYRPGYAIREFIEGKRVRHFKPLAFLLITAGLYAFVNHFFKADAILARDTGVQAADNSIEKVNEYIKEHFAVFVLLELPLVAYVYFLVFKKYGTSYLEQAVLCCYVSGLRTFINTLILPLNNHWPAAGYFLNLVMPLLLFVWAYSQFYADPSKLSITIRSILGFLVFYLLLIVVLSIVLSVLAS